MFAVIESLVAPICREMSKFSNSLLFLKFRVYLIFINSVSRLCKLKPRKTNFLRIKTHSASSYDNFNESKVTKFSFEIYRRVFHPLFVIALNVNLSSQYCLMFFPLSLPSWMLISAQLRDTLTQVISGEKLINE